MASDRWVMVNGVGRYEALTLREALGGFVFIAVGVGSALRLLLLGQTISLSALFAPACGAGILAGVYACTAVYRIKMERTQP